MAQIEFENVSLAFENNTIIEDFNLSINEGEIMTFFGPSGCGKSSIMKLVLGINKSTHGIVKIELEKELKQGFISFLQLLQTDHKVLFRK